MKKKAVLKKDAFPTLFNPFTDSNEFIRARLQLNFGQQRIYLFSKLNGKKRLPIYQQLDEERCQWCSCHYYIQVKTLGSL